MLSDVRDLAPLYDSARVVIAPTRFAAGIPLKILRAAAAAVPVVCTTLLCRQLGWRAGIEVLTADDAEAFAAACADLHENPELWQRIRRAGLDRIERDHSSVVFSKPFADASARH